MAELFAKLIFTAHLAEDGFADEFVLLDVDVAMALSVKTKNFMWFF